jgi:uncharacterized protein DUF3892
VVYIYAVHMNGGAEHEHIASVKWENPSTNATGQSTREAMVDWIKNHGGDARVRDNTGHDVAVGVVNATPPYIRTYADGVWTDNLLALPRY